MPISNHLPQRLKQIIDFVWGEHGGGFVQNEQCRPAIERLDDLDALPLAYSKLPDRAGRINLQPVQFRQMLDSGGNFVQVKQGFA